LAYQWLPITADHKQKPCSIPVALVYIVNLLRAIER
jgi:hypothetical protein